MRTADLPFIFLQITEVIILNEIDIIRFCQSHKLLFITL